MNHRHLGGVCAAIILVVVAGLCLAASPANTEMPAVSEQAENNQAGQQDECDQWAKNDAAQSMRMNMDEGGDWGMYMLNASTGPMPIVCLTRTDPFKPPQYRDIGTATRTVPGGAVVQDYFNQGLQFYYAFNNRESYRAFRYAAAVASVPTPACAMCYVGQTLALGPDINMPRELEPDRHAAQRVLQDAGNALKTDLSRRTITPEEGAEINVLIEALKLRFQDCPPGPDCQTLRNNYYMQALSAQFSKYQNDPDYLILFADAAMVKTPWGYWNPDGTPKSEEIRQAQAALKAALSTKPTDSHNGLIHWYIHLMEMSGKPEDAWPYAKMLAGLAPNAGHLVHMPSHIYYRVGDMSSSIGTNSNAVAKDQSYFKQETLQHPDGDRYRFGYYPHNIHFELASAALIGRKDVIEQASKTLWESAPDKATGYRADRYRAVYYLVRLNFATVSEIRNFPKPESGQPFAAVAYDYAQIYADVLDNNTASAENNYKTLGFHAQDYRKLDPAEQNPECDPTKKPPTDVNLCVVQIMSYMARARIDSIGPKDTFVIFDSMNKAIAIQDVLPYDEPPAWLYPVRQTLAGLVLWRYAQRRADPTLLTRAMSRLKESLPENSPSGRPIGSGVFPGNPWAYFGLWRMAQVLSPPDAPMYEQKYRALWRGAGDPDFRRM